MLQATLRTSACTDPFREKFTFYFSKAININIKVRTGKAASTVSMPRYRVLISATYSFLSISEPDKNFL